MKPGYGEGAAWGVGTIGRVTDPAETSRTLSVAAFFDVDNTIIRGASAYHIARGLREHGFFKRRDILRTPAKPARDCKGLCRDLRGHCALRFANQTQK